MNKELMLQSHSHRPYPLPNLKWIMTQEWHHTLFAHWPVPLSFLKEHVPHELEIDTFADSAWIGIVLFQVKNTRGRFTPAIPFLSSYLEVNVRTYVRFRERTGVYFFSLDANHLLTVIGAKLTFGLNYKQANITFSQADDFKMASTRLGTGARLKVRYQPITGVFFAKPGTLEHWLTERYCLWTKRGNQLVRGDIHHAKWELQRAQAELEQEMLIPFANQQLSTQPPLLHYNQYKKAFFWPPKLELQHLNKMNEK
ncbi:YqjF family protein [Mesobacillus subterraneus]|uniref:DUF2071 domain-containing protein n=1 Tax=Mesobacillus subterraneus TaxID=285983 RepID=A0A3R9DPY8_9BACI|nr:DUF2071 domain-containing protein [Mesobacillus subterraneus]RSD24062.1 DUF2071 domain-containing protein [Mesobacillus subterraneus]